MLDRPPGTPRAGGPNWFQDRMFRHCRFGMHVAVKVVANRQTNRKGTALITSTIRITTSENPNGEIVRVLRALIEPTRVETGCISCGLYKDLHDPRIIVWVEEWNTQDDLERHVRSLQYKKVLAAFDMSNSQPEMRFNTVVETKGMQLIAEARGMES